jgi:hypothetical protein
MVADFLAPAHALESLRSFVFLQSSFFVVVITMHYVIARVSFMEQSVEETASNQMEAKISQYILALPSSVVDGALRNNPKENTNCQNRTIRLKNAGRT